VSLVETRHDGAVVVLAEATTLPDPVHTVVVAAVAVRQRMAPVTSPLNHILEILVERARLQCCHGCH
jgi:hypothetical protein